MLAVTLFLWAVGLGMMALALAAARQLLAADQPSARPNELVAVILPCRGIDPGLPDLLERLAAQDLPHFRLYFVFADAADAAIPLICAFLDDHAGLGKWVLFPPPPDYDAKIANMLGGIAAARADEAAYLVFLDSDTLPHPTFVADLIAPLCQNEAMLSTGARVLVPADGNLAQWTASLWLQGSLPGVTQPQWGSAWGGAMALRVSDAESLGVEKIWANAFSDDHTLSRAVRKAGGRIAFVPGCLISNPAHGGWGEMLDFIVRQLLVLRLHDRRLWFSTWVLILPLFTTLAVLLLLALGRWTQSLALASSLLPAALGFYAMNEAVWRRLRLPGIRLRRQSPLRQLAAITALMPLHTVAMFRSAFARRFLWRERWFQISGRGMKRVE